MSKLEYVGEIAGLVPHCKAVAQGRGGDMANPANYNVICSCEQELGPLAKFTANPDGYRTALCTTCQRVTILNTHGQIVKVAPFDFAGYILQQKMKLCAPTK